MSLRLIPAVHRATHQIGLCIERSRVGGVNQAEAHILSHLAEHGEATITQLHLALAHKRSTLTSILDRLVARRLATRRESPGDGRVVVVGLTRRGRSLAGRVYRLLERLEREALGSGGAKQLQSMLAILDGLERRAASLGGD